MKQEDTSRQPLPSLKGGEGGGSLKQRTAQGLIWGGFSNIMMQLLQTLFGVWLLNILTPDDYGKVAALVIFSNLASVLQESGFTAALANKREPTHEEYNAVFWFNVIVGLLLYVILFFAAPLIADFYHEPVLVPLGRLAFLGFVISSLGTAQRAYLFGHLKVKETGIMQMGSILFSNIAAVCLAYAGMAYWGLAIQSLVYVACVTSFAWYFSPWRPTWLLSNSPSEGTSGCQSATIVPPTGGFRGALLPAWQMFGFSSKLLVNSLAFQFNNNAFGVLLNRFFPGGYIAGIYDNARKWDDRAIATINGMIQGVAQPVLRESSRPEPADSPPALPVREGANTIVDERALPSQVTAPSLTGRAGGESALSATFRKLLRFTCFVSFPCLFGLALVAEDFIVLLAGEKWHESALLLSLLCIYGAFTPIVTLYSNLVISRGRSTINMVIGLVNCGLVWGGIIALHALGYELRAMVIYYVALNIAWLLVWQACARRLIGLSWWHALKDVFPFLLFAVGVMTAAWWLTSSMPLSWFRMILRILLAVALYVGSLWLARAQILMESIDYIFKRKK